MGYSGLFIFPDCTNIVRKFKRIHGKSLLISIQQSDLSRGSLGLSVSSITKEMKDLKKLDKNKLNPKQERFCKLYSSDREFFGNGVQTYIEVYQPDRSKPNWYKTACSEASRMLSNAKVFTRINELLEENGLNDAFVDKQLLFLISQHEDKTNKNVAIREYNKLKSRITDKSDETVINNYLQLTDEQLQSVIIAKIGKAGAIESPKREGETSKA